MEHDGRESPSHTTGETAPNVDALVRAVPLEGVLGRGRAVTIGWPRPDEFDRITQLRNQPQTLPWFIDREPLDPEANRAWLDSGLPKPYESILAVRWVEDDSFLGSVGWMDWQPAEQRIALGRLMVDHKAVLKVGSRFPSGYRGVAIDAARTLGRFVVATMNVRTISYCYFQDNPRAQRVAELGGLRVLERTVEQTPDGRTLVTIEAAVP